jgi:ABC-2 type transport system ATP-binding protein
MGSMAESDTTVLLSSHLLADLERVCDYLIVLNAAQVRLAGTVDELTGQHRRLIGPRAEGQRISGVSAVLKASHTDRQSTLLVRTDSPIRDTQWTVHDVPMEDVILAYLAEGGQRVTHEAWGVSA